MDNRNFELKERLDREREASDPELVHAEIDRYVPYFFRNLADAEWEGQGRGFPVRAA